MALSSLFIQAASKDLQNGVAVLESGGRVTWANNCFCSLFGLEEESIQGLAFPADLNTEESSEDINSEIEQGIATGMGASGLKQYFAHRDGTSIGVYVNLIPVMAMVSQGGPEKFLLYVKELEDESGYTATITQRHQALSQKLPPLDA